jgi:hypothetical protein
VGGKRHPSSCEICLFLAKTVARVASLSVFARFRGGGAGCGDGTGNCGISCGDSTGNEGPAAATDRATEAARPAADLWLWMG